MGGKDGKIRVGKPGEVAGMRRVGEVRGIEGKCGVEKKGKGIVAWRNVERKK